LRLMERPQEERVTRVVARDIARREQLKALIAGSIASLGSHYVLALEAINAETGDVMAREQVEAASREQVLTALGGGATRLRTKLGESLASVERFDVPLPRATTASLEALHAYAMALDDGRPNVRLSAIPHLKRAVEIDPEFALGHAMLSAVYANTDQPGLAPAYAKRAFELRDRVSERERFFIGWRYYRDGTFAADKALDLARSWAATYPRESVAFNSLGLSLTYVGQYGQGIDAFREAMRLDPKFFAPYGNIAEAQLALGHLDEAKAVLELADKQQINVTLVRRVSYLLAFMRDDAAEMARQFERASAVAEGNPLGWQARTSLFAGRIGAAHEEYRRAIQIARDRGLGESAAQLMAEDSEGHAIAGQCAVARREANAALALSRDNFTLLRTGRSFALCGDRREVQDLADELRGRFPDAVLAHRVLVPMGEAMLAIGRGDGGEARRILEPVAPYDRAQIADLWPWYLRGLADLQSKAGREAAVQFQNVIDHRGVRPTSPLFPLAHLGLARAAALAGDSGQARTMYAAFLALWSGADPDIKSLTDARTEQARLQ
jgi:eukaryotic-like serine/threonine-protein kinase